MSALLEDLHWRYATKSMNGETVPQDKLDYIVEAARLAPSSSGLQPYQVFVISGSSKEKIIPAAMAGNQNVIAKASHVLVFAAWDRYTEERVTHVFDRTNSERGLPANVTDEYKKSLLNMYTPLPDEWHYNHAARQAYIALGLAMAAAAEQQVDATPMEGFDNGALDNILSLNEKGLKSAVILALGYRDVANDWLVNLKKVRTPKDEFITVLD